jgi:uncharacterized protein (DUF1330 family)
LETDATRMCALLVGLPDVDVVGVGEWPHTRTVLIEFPSDQAVREFYDSDAYQAIVGHRHAAASAEIAIVSGFG